MGQRIVNTWTSRATLAIGIAAGGGAGCYTQIPTVDPDGGGVFDGGGDADRVTCSSRYPTFCDGTQTCVELHSDGKNCGTCGHDCLGGTCVDSQCQPIMIAQYLGEPEIITVGTDVVYVTTDLGYVGRVKKDGTDLKPIAMPGFASSAYYGTLVAEDGDRVFLVRIQASTLQLSYCSTSGCDASATAVGGPYTQFFTLDAADHQLVWIDYSPSRVVAAPSLGSVPGRPIPGGALASGASGSRLLYAQGGVFYSDGGTVYRLPLSGGSFIAVASGNSPLSIVGANSNFLYVYDGAAIGYVPLPNGTGRAPTPLITTSLNPSFDGHFAADDTTAYWVDDGMKTVKTCQLSNCSSSLRLLPVPTNEPVEDVAIDDANLYMLVSTYDAANGGGSGVWKLAR